MSNNLEFQVKTFLKNNFEKWTTLIEENQIKFTNKLFDEKILLFDQETKTEIATLIKLSLIEKIEASLPVIKSLKLIGDEFVVLNTTSKRGKQPSIDLLAYNLENYCLAIIELKISSQTERQTITELSAYNQGLLNRFRGLSTMEVVWVPICTDWRITLASALEFQMTWNSILAVPLILKKYQQDATKKTITGLELDFFDPLPQVHSASHLSLFSYECFDTFEYWYTEDIKDKNAFTNYVTAICTKHKINGFVVYHKPELLMQFPYGFTICTYNAYKGNLFDQIAYDEFKNGNFEKFKSIARKTNIINTKFYDIDFTTAEMRHWKMTKKDLDGTSLRSDAYWRKKFLSVGDFAENAESLNLNFMFKDLKEKIESSGSKTRALGMSSFSGLMKSWNGSNIDSVTLFGIHLDLIVNKIRIEHKKGLHTKELFHLCNSFNYLKKSFKEMSY